MKITVLDGARIKLSRTPAAVRDAIEILSKLPNGQLLTFRALCERMITRRSAPTMRNHATRPTMQMYRYVHGYNRVYFGNPKTVLAARKQFNEN